MFNSYFSYDLGIFQVEGNRHYEGPSIVLTADQIRKLKCMNKVSIFDQSYIGYLLAAVFDSDALLNLFNNGNVPQTALDGSKLKFIEGNFRK